MAKEVNPTITLLHIIGNEREQIAAEQQLEIFASGFDFGTCEIHKRVLIGDVLNDLGKIAEGMNATVILMGTHGEKAYKKFLEVMLYGWLKTVKCRLLSFRRKPFTRI